MALFTLAAESGKGFVDYMTSKISIGPKVEIPNWGLIVIIIAIVAVIATLIAVSVMLRKKGKRKYKPIEEKENVSTIEEQPVEQSETDEELMDIPEPNIQEIDIKVKDEVTATEAVAEEPIVEEVVAEEQVEEEPIVEEVVAEEQVEEEPVVEEVVAEEPIVEEQVAEEPIVEEEVAEEPIVEEPVVEEEVAEEPIAEEEVAEEPIAEEEVAEEPIAEEPIAKEQVAEKVVAEEPVVEEKKAEPKAAAKPKKETKKPATKKVAKKEENPQEEVHQQNLLEKNDVIFNRGIVENEQEVASAKVETNTDNKVVGKFEICNSNLGGFTYLLRANNGQLLYESKDYRSVATCKEALKKFVEAVEEGRFSVRADKFKNYKFNLNSPTSNTLIYIGESFNTEVSCKNNIESVKRFAPISPIVDLTEEDYQTKYVYYEIPEEKRQIVDAGAGAVGKWEIMRVDEEDKFSPFEYLLYANNGQLLYESRDYKTYASCLNGLKTFINTVRDGFFVVDPDKSGRFKFVLRSRSANSSMLYYGQNYDTQRACESSIESVYHFALRSPLPTNSNK